MTTSQPIVTRTTRDGRTATVAIVSDGVSVYAEARLDGVYYTSGRPVADARGPASHVIRNGSKVLGLLPAEAEAIIAALREADQAAAATPEAQMERLREQRRLLAAKVAGALDDVQIARERAMSAAYDDPDGDGNALAGMPAYDGNPKVAAAREALARFDTENPEVVEAIRAEGSVGLQTGAAEKE